MVASRRSRSNFISKLIELMDLHNLDGIDYNWEYPGFTFGKGYEEHRVTKDYEGFGRLLVETQKAFVSRGKIISLAYYPDGSQAQQLVKLKAHRHVDLLHMMTYDQQGRHSTMQFARSSVRDTLSIFPEEAHKKITLGLPFYGRNINTGSWTTYEDLIKKYPQIIKNHRTDQVGDEYFNNIETIRGKTKFAIESGLGGVMIWEVGQDCRVSPVTRRGVTHVATCPSGRKNSLLNAIGTVVAEKKLVEEL
eukprot:TRINITY_DN3315_c0_g1_i3.p1 TRINITY_DN3315_c0_g1~~TRINITY_DN3315_c0_g1_i3.p1  ORF type:complete len:249 (-),score=24.62 TRINITY_DN3315_c0_g1_i3:130-876(-)